MRVEARAILAMLAAIGVGTTAFAFEPGKERVCVASADGTRFECRDKQAGDSATHEATVAPDRTTAEPATPAPTDVPEPEPTRAAAAPAAASGSTGALPNYLLQDPSSTRPAAASAPEPEPARPASTAAPASAPAATRPAAPAAAPRDETTVPVAAPAPTPMPAAPAVVPASTPATEPVPAATAAPPRQASPAAMPPAQRAGGHAEFRRLAGTRYTLEVARADRAGAFDALLAALADVDGRFYVVALRNPAGLSYSLLWNDYASIEDARAARARLPGDVAITSGWPRRIGPLQAELGP